MGRIEVDSETSMPSPNLQCMLLKTTHLPEALARLLRQKGHSQR
jgi:hypothetical protein